MEQEILKQNPESGRVGIWNGEDWERDGLHCGEYLEVFVHEKWVPTRMECGGEGVWFLAGLAGIPMNGLRVRQIYF